MGKIDFKETVGIANEGKRINYRKRYEELYSYNLKRTQWMHGLWYEYTEKVLVPVAIIMGGIMAILLSYVNGIISMSGGNLSLSSIPFGTAIQNLALTLTYILYAVTVGLIAILFIEIASQRFSRKHLPVELLEELYDKNAVKKKLEYFTKIKKLREKK